MTREQMIAWLTLEGWEPCTGGHYPSVVRGASEVWWDTDTRTGAYWEGDDGHIVGERVVAAWSNLSDWAVSWAYQRISGEVA